MYDPLFIFKSMSYVTCADTQALQSPFCVHKVDKPLHASFAAFTHVESKQVLLSIYKEWPIQ